MKHAPGFDGLLFDPFSLLQDGLAAPEVDVGRHEFLQALVVAPMVVMLDKSVDLLPEIAWEVVVFHQDVVLQGLVPSIARQAIAKQSAGRGSILPWVCG